MPHEPSSEASQLAASAPQPETRAYDVIIVGSGMSGLSAAVIFAKEGKRVLVLEQHYRPGGYIHRFFRRRGVSFDVGFHYFGAVEPQQVLGAYLNYFGVLDRIELLPLDPDGYDELRFPDQRFVVPAGEERYRERLLRAFPSERAGIERYFADLQRIVDGFAFYRLRAEQDVHHADRWMSVTLGDYLSSLTKNERLIAVLSGQNPLYGVEPHRAPVALHALVTDSFMQNPYSIRGGGDALAQAMVKRVRELGGEVKLRRRVTEILVSDGPQVRGVRTARGEEFHAPLVMSCAHPKVTVRLLPEDVLRPGYRRRVLSMEDGPGSLSVFVTTRQDLSSYGRRNIYNYKVPQIGAVYGAGPYEHRFAFVSVPTAREGVGKGGLHQVVGLGLLHWKYVEPWVDTMTGKRGADYEAFKQEHAARLLDLMYEAVPELKGAIETVETATPLTNRDYTTSEGGATYGIHHSVEQSGRYGLRPRTRVGGLYLMGQSALMPGICGVTISAVHACSLILGEQYLMRKIHEASGL